MLINNSSNNTNNNIIIIVDFNGNNNIINSHDDVVLTTTNILKQKNTSPPSLLKTAHNKLDVNVNNGSILLSSNIPTIIETDADTLSHFDFIRQKKCNTSFVDGIDINDTYYNNETIPTIEIHLVEESLCSSILTTLYDLTSCVTYGAASSSSSTSSHGCGEIEIIIP
jgi:hypothetical protein